MEESKKRSENIISELRPDKTVPYSAEAEQAVLGSILIDPDSISSAAAKLNPNSFYIKRHRDIFGAMLELYDLSLPVEGLVLLEKLREKDLFRGDEDKTYLLSLADAASSVTNTDYFINIIKEKYALRCIIKTCAEVAAMSYENENSDLILDAAANRFTEIQNGEYGKEMQPLTQLVRNEMNRLEEMVKDTTGKYEPVRIGISDFDNFIGGLNNSDLVVVAARPGVGKTSFALNIAYNIATSTRYSPKKSVAFFSLEMSNEQLTRRIISSALAIESEALRRGTINESQWNDIYNFHRMTLKGTKFLLNEETGITVAKMKENLRRVDNLGLVVIDYLQLMSGQMAGVKNSDSRVNEISAITRSIKLMAKELNVPVILLSQLSRDITKRTDKTPQLSDLRDSGSIEQDADIVIFISKHEKDETLRDICIQKNRHGSTGTITLHWDGEHTSFKALDKRMHE